MIKEDALKLAIGGSVISVFLGGAYWGVKARGPRVYPGNVGRLSDGDVKSWPGRWSDDLRALNPAFRKQVNAALKALEKQGYKLGREFTILQTWRSERRQQHMIDRGWSSVTKSYHTVTNPDGTPNALAVDFAPSGIKSERGKAAFYHALWAASSNAGMTSGASWSRTAKPWDGYALGWDPGHIQVRGTTIAKANANNPKGGTV